MTPKLYRYRLDPTGVSRDNYVTNEAHAIGVAPRRAIAPTYGAFFPDSMEIVDLSTQKTLTRDQFAFQELQADITASLGAAVVSLVVITDASVSPNVSLTYQAVGGGYSTPIATISDEIAALALDNRGVTFNNITGKPDDFTPVLHFHAIGDTYDWDYVVTALEMILNALSIIEAASYDSTLMWIDQQEVLKARDIASLTAQLAAHMANYNNPHQTTLAQVDVYVLGDVVTQIANETTLRTNADNVLNANVSAHAGNTANPHHDTAQNVGGYTSVQADANLATIVAGLNATITHDATVMSAHIANTSNPHQLTLAQINAMSTTDINSAITTGLAGINTQLNVSEAAATAHIANANNPHNTTLAQINGWASANIAAVNTQVAAHIANVNNPHGVTAAQVGTLTAAQITSNMAVNFTTPAQTSYLNPQSSTISSHVNNVNNPHNTTVAILGGWTYAQWQAAVAARVAALSY